MHNVFTKCIMSKHRIAGTLEPFLDNQGLPEIPNFEEKFPGDILIGQTIAVWKHIVQFQKNNTTHI